MSVFIHRENCLACSGSDIHPVLDAKDYTVSGESFAVWHCNSCGFRFTQDIADEANIGKYYQSENYISHSNTKAGIVNSLYHCVRRYTLVQKKKLIQSVTGLAKGKLLDIGAGTGAFASAMQKNGWEVTGVEPDEGARSQAKNNFGLKLDEPTILIALEAKQFDAISLWHVLEHVHDLHGYWNLFEKLLKQEGRLVIAVPNYTSYDAKHYGAYWAAYDVPRHLYHFSPQSMEQLAKNHGFIVEQVKPMWFDSVYVSLLSEQYKHGKPKMLAALCHGLMSNIKAVGNNTACSSLIYILKKN